MDQAFVEDERVVTDAVYKRIEAGMVFTAPADFGTDMQGDWVVVGPGTWIIVDGEVKWLWNHRNNKWWVMKVNGDKTIRLVCFDVVNYGKWKECNFRHPDKAYDTSK